MPRNPRSCAAALASVFLLSTPALAQAGTTDLSVRNPDIAGDTTVGSTVTYQTTVANNGPDADNPTLEITLEQSDQLVSVNAAQGTCTQAAPLVCTLGPLPAGENVAVAITSKLVKEGPGGVQLQVRGDGSSTDPLPDNNLAGATFTVRPAEPEVVNTPSVQSGVGESRTQTTLGVDVELTPYGAGTYYFEYGRTRSFGSKTGVGKVNSQRTVKRRALIEGLPLDTKIYWRPVMVVDGKTYRGKIRSETTLGKLLYPLITIRATRRTASSTTYVGTIGDGLADAPGACRGTVTMNVYTEGGDIMSPKTRTNAARCAYEITIPFGTRDARKYGPKGRGVFVQARFSGTKYVAAAGSTSDRP